MNRRRVLGLLAPAALAAVALAGCGGSGKTASTKNASATIAANDPASMVAPSVIAYADITVNPQGSVKADLVNSIDKLAGPGAADRLAQRIVSGSGPFFKDLSASSSDHIGVALTAIPASGVKGHAIENDLLVVVPTASPAAAKKLIADSGPPAKGETDRVVGNFAIAGGAAALSSIASSTQDSLAADPDYTAAISQLSGDQLATVFVRAKQFYAALEAVLAANPNSNPAESQTLASEGEKLGPHSSLALGLGVTQNTFQLDSVSHALPQTTGTDLSGDVGSLPGDSWLGVAFNFNAQFIKQIAGELPSIAAEEQAATGAAGGSAQSMSQIANDVISALGPLTLSVAGTSLGGIQAGLTVTPLNATAGNNLLNLLKQNLKSLPVLVSKEGKQIIVSFGYADPKDLTSPSSHLSDNPVYKAAVAQLPPGSHVPLYVNLGALSGFSALDKNSNDASLWSAIRNLDYLIAGGTGEHTRIVLGLK